ncbi:FAD-dependent monooxygenase [Streptomyces sp. LX-29]|uniref:FAD-dependent monooxygenase n=1 Tax=Streptomyces sp. LX-29 TaxID=2900152 RepID=UPI00240E1D70|nr:FAD-dependent monooxygenase [Streptomyces sp. LX-29]WFB11041.1 FAD-dependent monooxygenase [Streptomyces sp. LX-29]
MTPQPLIIGGGIAGVVAALALHKAGFDPVVYEARPETEGADDTGAFLLVFANGLAALRAVDAHRAVWDASFPAETVTFVSPTGKRLVTRPLAGSAPAPAPPDSTRTPGPDTAPDTGAGARRHAGADDDALGPRTLKRATLCRVLRAEAARRGIRIEYGKRFVAAHTGPDGCAVASFADGGRACGDLLIGADGVHSALRKTIDAAAPRPRYTGQNTVCGYRRATDPALPADLIDGYTMIYGKRAFFGCTRAPDGELWWFANAPGAELKREELATATPRQWRDRVAELFAGDDTPVADLVRTTDGPIVGSNAYDLATTPTWSRDAMVIIGDAAHAAAPNAAQGASMAIEDGVQLARCLRDLPDRGRALAAYEGLRRERVERAVATSAAMARQVAPGPVQRVLRDALSPRRLERGGNGADDWLTGHRIDWDAPVTAL